MAADMARKNSLLQRAARDLTARDLTAIGVPIRS
jgi:hypothetical protein